MPPRPPIPVTVFTGFLGAGKTTVIRHIVAELPAGYNVFWLKNEFGDAEVDAEVARSSHIAVREILNGCLCCTLVGALGDALEELAAATPPPDRIFLETSGSAYPAPLAWEVRKHAGLRLDGIATVIDAVNFSGYADRTITARLQAKYTDVILINKHELVDGRRLESLLDDVIDMNPDTPRVLTRRGAVAAALVLGLDSRLAGATDSGMPDSRMPDSGATDAGAAGWDAGHHAREVDVLQTPLATADASALAAALRSLPPESVIRAKGLVSLQPGQSFSATDVDPGSGPAPAPATGDGRWLFNLVSGRLTAEWLPGCAAAPRAIFMGWGLGGLVAAVAALAGVPESEVRYQPAAERGDSAHDDHDSHGGHSHGAHPHGAGEGHGHG